MQHRRLGTSAIVVSDICMGTMTFGSQTDEATALRILDRSYDAGINFYDTAEGYPVPPDAKWVGRTEEIVGKWLKTKPSVSLLSHAHRKPLGAGFYGVGMAAVATFFAALSSTRSASFTESA